MHKGLDGLEFWPDPITDYGASSPWAPKMIFFQFSSVAMTSIED